MGDRRPTSRLRIGLTWQLVGSSQCDWLDANEQIGFSAEFWSYYIITNYLPTSTDSESRHVIGRTFTRRILCSLCK